MTTILEYLPDEILLMICRHLSQYHIIQAFFNLNNRFSCTITQFYRSLTVCRDDIYTNRKSRQLLSLIGPYLQSLTVKDILLLPAEISLASNIQELTFIQTPPNPIPLLPHLTDLNIITGPSLQSIDVLFSNNNINLHSVYIAPSSPLTIPIYSPPKYSTIKQLAVTLQTADDFLHLLPVCPELVCLNLNLRTCDFTKVPTPDNLLPTNLPTNLRTFSLRTSYDADLAFDQLKTILQYLPSTLEHLAIEIFTRDTNCMNGDVWESYLKEKFPELQRYECCILFREEIPYASNPSLRLAQLLQTFQSDYWLLLIPQKVTGYYPPPRSRESLCIHTNVIPTVGRRRYFLN